MKIQAVEPYLLHSTFDFGKHRGKTIMDVLQDEPSYLSWCLRTLWFFLFEEETFEVLRKKYRFSTKAVNSQEKKIKYYHEGVYEKLLAKLYEQAEQEDFGEEEDNSGYAPEYGYNGYCGACGAGPRDGCLSSTGECYR
ncbi:MAG TPA: hypothetical protein DCM08_09550 [Microscillaceae bacterium]|nr:hypothetical protein [Microscillaceae bacterium]